MDQATCSTDGCDVPVWIKKWQLCGKHYQAKYRRGLDAKPHRSTRRHTLSAVDLESMTADCLTCGSGVPIVDRLRRPVCKMSERSAKWMNLHGLDGTQVEALLELADNKCQACSEPFSLSNPFCIDHDHECCPGVRSCGKCVRGLLCRRCNAGVGMFLNDVHRLLGAVAYLERGTLIWGPEFGLRGD
jgi:hypothetical protein